jgi:hypothetical protein
MPQRRHVGTALLNHHTKRNKKEKTLQAYLHKR